MELAVEPMALKVAIRSFAIGKFLSSLTTKILLTGVCKAARRTKTEPSDVEMLGSL